MRHWMNPKQKIYDKEKNCIYVCVCVRGINRHIFGKQNSKYLYGNRKIK